MDTQDFATTWAQLYGERAELISKRTDLENELNEVRTKITHLDEVLNHLAPLGNVGWTDEEISALGLTDAIRRVVQTADEKLSAQDIRQQLTEKGYDLSQLTAPMASIYKILSRLETAKELEREKDADSGRVFYTWKASEDDIPF